MDITEISDRLELEKLVTDYATAIDSRNFTELNNLFTPDASIDYTAVGGIAGSTSEIISFLETALDFFPNYQHFISNISLTINKNSASGKVMCFNPMQTKEGQTFFLGMCNSHQQRHPSLFLVRLMQRVTFRLVIHFLLYYNQWFTCTCNVLLDARYC